LEVEKEKENYVGHGTNISAEGRRESDHFEVPLKTLRAIRCKLNVAGEMGPA
jgi:hypothetical protein